MADKFSISAILSAKDNGFSSTLKNAMKTTDSLSSKLTSGFNFGILTGAGQQFFSTLTSGARDLMGEMSSASAAWKTFEGNMKILGKGEKEIDSAKKAMQDYATETIYSASDMANTYAQLAAVGIKNTDKLVTGFGGLAGAAENPTQAMKTLSQQATQMAAKPKVAWQDFKLMLEQTPAGIAAVAKHMGMTTSELVTAVQDGEVSTTAFFKAIEKVGNSDGFQKQAKQYKTAGQAMDGLKETLSNKLMPAYDMLSQKVIGALDGIITAVGKIDGDSIAKKVGGWVDKAGKYWTVAKREFAGVGKAISDAFSAIKAALGDTMGAFGSTKSLNTFEKRMEMVANVVKSVAGFFEKHADTIGKLVPIVGKLVGAFLGFKILNSIPGVSFLVRGIGALGKMGIGALANKLLSLGKNGKAAAEGAGELGSTSVQTGANMLKSAQSFALMGVAVLLIAAGFALLAQSAIALAGAGAPAIAVMAGLVVAVAALGFGMGALLKFVAPMGPKLTVAATAMVIMAAAVLIIAVAFGVLAGVAILLANSGGLAIGVMVGMVAVIALLAVGAAALAPALLAGAAGFTAFGAALLMVAAAALVAAVAVVIISTALPALSQYGLQGALAIAALGAAMLVFAAGAAVAGVALVVMSAGIVVFGVACVAAAVGIAAFGLAMTAAAVGVLAMAAALLGVTAEMKSISKNAKSAEKSLKSMKKSVKVVEGGLKAIGSTAKSAMKSLTDAFDNTASKAQSSGKKVVSSFTKGLNSGYPKAYAAGAYISTGFALGMLSQLSVVQAAANKLAAAADKAVRAKAQINSPSRVAMGLGEYWGEGYAIGLSDMVGKVQRAAQELVSVPQVMTPALATSYSGAMSADFDYYRNSEYTIVVPVEVDGKEVARTTAPYMQSELDKKQTRNDRKHGKA